MDQFGRLLGTTTVPATTAGRDQLVSWVTGFGVLCCFGLEGAGSYGVGLARHLRTQGLKAIEVVRSNRQTRRRAGKTDAVDAEIAATAERPQRPKGRARERVEFRVIAECQHVRPRGPGRTSAPLTTAKNRSKPGTTVCTALTSPGSTAT
ncbi:transposase [Saccharopolyspora spinosporotrichia]